MKWGKRGQATLELAIFGSLIFVFLGALISIGASLDEQQTVLQESFRMALRKAYDLNAFVSYNVMKNFRGPNATGGPYEGIRLSASGGSSVYWCIGDAENYGIMRVNETPDRYLPMHEEDDALVVRDIEGMHFDAQYDYEVDVVNGDPSVRRMDDHIVTILKIKDAGDETWDQDLRDDGRYD